MKCFAALLALLAAAPTLITLVHGHKDEENPDHTHEAEEDKSVCTTDSGAAPNLPCIFPFKFNGAVHTSCIWDMAHLTEHKAWCSTLVDDTGHHVGGQGKWGNCGPGCPIPPDNRNDTSPGSGTVKVPLPGSSSGEECSDEQFQCADKCIPKRWQCDYHKDCENGEDEQDCPAPECDAGQFSCESYKFNHTNCIPSHYRCDKEKDCHDNSDEQTCSKYLF